MSTSSYCKASDAQVTIDLGEDFTPTCMAHPDTYLNKVVVASQRGHHAALELQQGDAAV